MANTITTKILSLSARECVQYTTIQSDGSNETATVLYDSSVQATSYGDTDALTSGILEVYASSNVAVTGRIRLLWDASSPLVAMDIPTGSTGDVDVCFRRFGGLINTGGSGKTGDILLTTTGLASGDTITLVLTILRN